MQTVGELRTVVCLDALNGKGERGNDVAEEERGGVCAQLFKCLQITETAVLIQEGILVELLSGRVKINV